MSASPAGALEDPDVARLPSGVVAVNNGDTRREAQRLILREGIHSPVMEYGVERHGIACSPHIGQVFPRKRDDLPRLD